MDWYKSDQIPLDVLINQGVEILIWTSLCAKYEKQKIHVLLYLQIMSANTLEYS